MKIEFELLASDEVNDSVRDVFGSMLGKQGKVRGQLRNKADRCKLLCISRVDGVPVAIGAIKRKTEDDFTEAKSGLIEFQESFEWELGYLFTETSFERQGIASNIVTLLLRAYGSSNLMASTEINANHGMVKILERNHFRLFGKPWKSEIHGNYLGLFLRFE